MNRGFFLPLPYEKLIFFVRYFFECLVWFIYVRYLNFSHWFVLNIGRSSLLLL